MLNTVPFKGSSLQAKYNVDGSTGGWVHVYIVYMKT